MCADQRERKSMQLISKATDQQLASHAMQNTRKATYVQKTRKEPGKGGVARNRGGACDSRNRELVGHQAIEEVRIPSGRAKHRHREEVRIPSGRSLTGNTSFVKTILNQVVTLNVFGVCSVRFPLACLVAYFSICVLAVLVASLVIDLAMYC